MSEYKNTLNLPKTDFPMKANLAEREPTFLKKWQDLDLYAKLREIGKGKSRFVLHDGPPYTNGHIHMGHAINKTLKDMIVKSKTLSGYDAPYVPGWDCHGLPIELLVEKKIGKVGVKADVLEFVKACREYAKGFLDIQREEFKRLGIFGEWDAPYYSMNPTFEANIIRALAQILKNGHLFKGYKPVHWCLDCGSALAEAEVEYADKTSAQIDVRFKIVDQTRVLSLFKNASGTGNISIPIWTTTPWTLPANQAVSLHADLTYVLVQTESERLILAEKLLETALKRYEIENFEILGTILGGALEGIQLQHPFYDRMVPVVLGDHVTVESGTGAVHTAPAHGQDDYVVGKKYNLVTDNPVGDDGCYISTVEHFAGRHVNKVNDDIIEMLKTNQALLHSSKLNHSFPHCWRHKTPLIFRSTPQWFISMEQNGLRDMALQAIEHVNWVPDWGYGRIFSMMKTRPDWCISRQRTWGVPIALFLHKETGEIHPDSVRLMEEVAARVEKEGIEAWIQLDVKDVLGEDAKNYQKSRDILDVWFDSGSTNFCVLRHNPKLHFPADLYLEGSDQHRGWFNSSLLVSLAVDKVVPYKTVLTHGYVVDGQGRKMSKSLGNVIAPESIINKYGADILRLWAASVDYRNEINVSNEILTRISETYRRLRNTARFLLANLEGFEPEKNLVETSKLLALDRWAINKTRCLQNEIVGAYETYQFHTIYQKIHHFCAVDLGSFYLDIIKDRQYTTKSDSLARRSAQTAMFHIIEALVRWLAPILSFTAEEIWQYLPGKRNESVFLNTWYTELAEVDNAESMNDEFWQNLQRIRYVVNKEIEVQRNAGVMGSALEANVNLYCEADLKLQLDKLGNELRFVFITSKATVHAKPHDISHLVQTEVPGLWLKVIPMVADKCERCWHRVEDVGQNTAHPTLCLRCVENLEGEGEVRKFA